MEAGPRFLCDGMLGDVARWLRLLGFDAAYAGSQAADDELLEGSVREGRILATRDVALAQRAQKRGVPCVRLSGGSRTRELEALLRGVGAIIDRARCFTRCTHCNHPLERVEPVQVQEKVPPAAWAAHASFSRCTGCGHVYWEGTHVAEIEREVQEIQKRLAQSS